MRLLSPKTAVKNKRERSVLVQNCALDHLSAQDKVLPVNPVFNVKET